MNLEVLYQENLELRAKLKLLTDKPLERKKIVHTKADLIFSDYIRKRANYCCERCGKHYPPKTNGLQCSHNFSRVTTIFVTILIMPLHYAIIAICGMAMNQLRVENGL